MTGQKMEGEQSSEQPTVSLTDGAIQKVRHALKDGTYDGVRITVKREKGRFTYSFDTIAAGKADPDDPNVKCGEYRFYIHQDSVALIRGSEIDYVDAGLTQGWVIDNPNHAWDSELARDIAQVFEETINPGLSQHGGSIKLVDLKDDIAYVEMSGGCQGCSMAAKTLRHGIMGVLADRFPQVTGLVDVTDHSGGTNPFYTNSEGDSPDFKR